MAVDTERVTNDDEIVTRSTKYDKFQIWFQSLHFKYLIKALGLGQVLSLLLCGTAVTSGILQVRGVSIPTSQTFLNYILLCLVYAPLLACRQGEGNLVPVLVDRGWKYFLLSLIDVEANFMVVKAYEYTTVTSVQLLDCFTIPVVLILSWIFLKSRYKVTHYIGVVICILGVGALVLADVFTNKNGNSEAKNMLLGDFLCLGGATLYAISNVAEEFLVKNFNRVEFLAMIGLFGSIISGIQVMALESKTITEVDFSDYRIILCLLGFAISLFFYYSLVPIVMQLSSAATVNLSILSADFYALLFGLFLFQYKFHSLYFVSFVCIIIGVIVYCARKTPTAEESNQSENNDTENNSLTTRTSNIDNSNDDETTPLNTGNVAVPLHIDVPLHHVHIHVPVS